MNYEEFWNSKKALLESTGLLVAIGAIFLVIPLPENTEAKNALFNVQMIWLFVITILLLVIFWNFYKFFINWEKKFLQSKESNVFAILILFIIWIMYYLWKYVLILYHDQLVLFLPFAYSQISLLNYAFLFFISKKGYNIYNSSTTKFYYWWVIMSILDGTAMSILSEASRLTFHLNNFINSIILGSTVAFIVLGLRVSTEKRSQKNL